MFTEASGGAFITDPRPSPSPEPEPALARTLALHAGPHPSPNPSPSPSPSPSPEPKPKPKPKPKPNQVLLRLSPLIPFNALNYVLAGSAAWGRVPRGAPPPCTPPGQRPGSAPPRPLRTASPPVTATLLPTGHGAPRAYSPHQVRAPLDT